MFFDGESGVTFARESSFKNYLKGINKMVERSREGEEEQFEFPNAEQLRQSAKNSLNNAKVRCRKYVEDQLWLAKKNIDLSSIDAFIIQFHKHYQLDLMLECAKEVLEGKGFDISTVDNGRGKGVVVKW